MVKASCGVYTGRSKIVELWPAFGGNEVTSKEHARICACSSRGRRCAQEVWLRLVWAQRTDLHFFFFRASSYLFGGVLFLVVQFEGNSEYIRNSFESRPGSPLPASDGQLHALCGRSLALVRERFSLLNQAAQYFSVIDPRDGSYVGSWRGRREC
mmetsp:Transcript_14291/g.38864  ORF Transcript_14291/g.38864 Transcript_14291/m.38864 type:complete len:155 (+) Transcript_14291:1481-1945(+)